MPATFSPNREKGFGPLTPAGKVFERSINWEGGMISTDKQYEFLTSQTTAHSERSLDAFKLFIQIFSAIVGGSIWLSVQGRWTLDQRHSFSTLSNILVCLIAFVTIAMISDNLRAWHGYRVAISKLSENEQGISAIPAPRMLTSPITEFSILSGLLIASAIFIYFNPFSIVETPSN